MPRKRSRAAVRAEAWAAAVAASNAGYGGRAAPAEAGGAAAALAAAHEAAPAGAGGVVVSLPSLEEPLPPRIFGPRGSGRHRLSRSTHDTAVLDNPASLHFVSLMDAGIVADPAEAERAVGGRRGHSMSSASESMMAAYRRLLPYDGTKHSGSLVLHGYGMAGGNGLPVQHVAAYMGNGDGPMADALHEAALQAVGGSFVPGVLRIDTHFETKVAHADRDTAAIPTALVGGRAVPIPHLHSGQRASVSSPDSLRSAIRSYIRMLQGYIDDMPTKASNRTLSSLVSSNVWFTPSHSARHGVITRRPADTVTGPRYDPETGEPHMPASFYSSRAFVFDGDFAWPGQCIARAIVRGLDPFMDAQSDTHIVELVRRSLRGAESMLRAANRLLDAADPKAGTGAVYKRRLAERDNALRVVAAAEEEVRNTIAMVLSTGSIAGGVEASGVTYTSRTYKGDPRFTPRQFSVQERAKYVDIALRNALMGRHPLCNFSDARYQSAQRIDADSVAAIRNDLAPCVKVQFWTVGVANRVVLAFPDPSATLQWLRSDGHNRLVNVLFAHKHVAWIRDITTACGHVFVDKAGEDYRIGGNRIYCALCGYCRGRTHAYSDTKLYEHQLLGCEKEGGALMTTPLSPANCRQLSYLGYRALNMPLVMAALTAEPFPANDQGILRERAADIAAWACTEEGWFPIPLWSAAGHEHEDEELLKAWDKYYAFDRMHATEKMPGHLLEDLNLSPESRTRALHAEHDATGVRPMLTILCRFALPSTVDRLWKALHYNGPRDERKLRALLAKPRSKEMCFACKLPVEGPSTWALQRANASRAAEAVDDHLEAEDEGEGSDSEKSTVELEAGDLTAFEPPACEHAPVIHHCHATGEVAWAHNDCNTLMRQSSSELIVDVGSQVSMAAAVDVLFSRAFYALFLHGQPPTLLRSKDGAILSVQFTIRGTDRSLHPGEIAARRAAAALAGSPPLDELALSSIKVKKCLRITLRPMSSMLPASPETSRMKEAFDAMVNYCENNFFLTGLWPGLFPTAISYARNVLMRSLPPGEFATSIASKSTYDHVLRMTRGGAIVIGEAAEMTPLSARFAPQRRSIARLYFDISANYPSQLISPYPIPLKEHADRRTRDFGVHVEPPLLEDAVHYITHADLTLPVCERIEISGYWPESTHARLRKFPPNFEPIEVSPRDFSKWQQQACGYSEDDPPFRVCAGHLRNVERRVVFLRTARFWLQLGFQLTWAGFVYSTPASHWARSFGETMERERRTVDAKRAEAEEDGVADVAAHYASLADNVKFISNAVIGALNTDTGSFTTLRTMPIEHKGPGMFPHCPRKYGERKNDRPSIPVEQSLSSDAGFTGRILQAGDCHLYEMRKKHWKHTQQTMAAFFIQEMARIDHLRILYGEQRPEREGGNVPGILEAFPNAIVGYGNTDSLVVEVNIDDFVCTPSVCDLAGWGVRDVRHALYGHMHKVFDISNVPPTSSFWTEMPTRLRDLAAALRGANAGRWGLIKEETGWAGVDSLVVIGPNRWGLSVLQHPTDTLDKHRGSGAHVLKSIPRAWQGAVTLDQFRADLDHKIAAHTQKPLDPVLEEPERLELPLPTRVARPPGAPLGVVAELDAPMKEVAVWGNRACRVELQPLGPPRHVPFGCLEIVKLHG